MIKVTTMKRNAKVQAFIDACDEIENAIYWKLIEAPMAASMIATAPVAAVRSAAEALPFVEFETKEF